MEKEIISTIEKETLLLKYTQGQASLEESHLVESWLTGSKDLQHETTIIRKALTLDSKINEYCSFQSDKAFEEVNKKLENNARKRKWIRHMSAIAASLAIPLLISTLTFGYLFFDQKTIEADQKVQYVEVTSSPGLITRLELPDHSVVHLNAGSYLRYPSVFSGNTREVELKGEGYFEVQSDKEHPFFVTTKSGVRVMAHGTQFNVNTYDEHENVEAILVKGKIDIHAKEKFIAALKPGEKISYNKNTHMYSVNPVNLYEHTAWKDGKTVFRNSTLDDVFKILGRKFNVNIVLHTTKANESYKFWATFTDETIYQIFNYLEEAAPIKWKVNSMKQNSDTTFAKQQIDVWLK